MLNPLALELNHVIEERNKPVYEMFSMLGKSLY